MALIRGLKQCRKQTIKSYVLIKTTDIFWLKIANNLANWKYPVLRESLSVWERNGERSVRVSPKMLIADMPGISGDYTLSLIFSCIALIFEIQFYFNLEKQKHHANSKF